MKNTSISSKIMCTHCSGIGELNLKQQKKCEFCSGTGGNNWIGKCNKCNGSGKITFIKIENCYFCAGRGHISIS